MRGEKKKDLQKGIMPTPGKTVLVICSQITGRDYPRIENQEMLKTIVGDNYTPEFMPDPYPNNLPRTKKFDAILFAGCNVIDQIFTDYNRHTKTFEPNHMEKGMERLSTMLKKDGYVIFVETRRYVEHFSKQQHYNLSFPLSRMNIFQTTDNHAEVKQRILDTWNTYFKLVRTHGYYAYQVKPPACQRSTCIGVFKSGQPCNLKAKRDNLFCGHHTPRKPNP